MATEQTIKVNVFLSSSLEKIREHLSKEYPKSSVWVYKFIPVKRYSINADVV